MVYSPASSINYKEHGPLIRTLLAILAIVTAPHPTHHVKPKPRQRLGTHYTVDSTSYCQSGTTASGKQTYWGEVANNFLPLGTLIKLDQPVNGKSYFRVEDHIGYGSQLDIFQWSCTAALDYGRREIGFRVVL